MKSKKPIRIKITETYGISYIVIQDGYVSYIGGSEIPLALSNLVGNKAAELRFALQDVESGEQALKIVKESCAINKKAALIELL